MADSCKIISASEMLDFYRKLDVVELKYSIDKKNPNKIQHYQRLEELESDHQLLGLTKVEYGDILSNLDMVYASREKSDEIIELFDLIRTKIVSQYINIEGLERLFSEKYIDFEWDMHLGIDYREHKMNYYRDHFIHQVRDAYCIHVLLEDIGLLDKVQDILTQAGNSKVSSFVYKCVEQQKILGYFSNHQDSLLEKYNKESGFYYRNIIYMSTYMAALFHDIGYPETFNSANQRRITEYIANLYNAESSGYNYTKLNSLLQNSLLFRVVSFEEIKGRLSGDKPDHGVLSAIIFLMNFYENGAVHRLEPYKKCAVELAALAIYNHTNKYSYGSSDEKGKYIRIAFRLNPISYLLRICDDLQEWDRIYFEISKRSNLILCRECKTPIFRKRSGNSPDKGYYYFCNCNYMVDPDNVESAGVFDPIFKYDENFPYRRIYNVTVCDQLKIIPHEKTNAIVFRLEYNLGKLLHIAYINPEYAKYRIKELNKFKKLLDYQPNLPPMKIEYFVTANPVLIKTRILREYLKDVSAVADVWDEVKELLKLTWKIENEVKGTERKKLLEKWTEKYNRAKMGFINHCASLIESVYTKTADVIKDSVKEAVSLYVQMMIFMKLYEDCNQKEAEMFSYAPASSAKSGGWGFLEKKGQELFLESKKYDYDENLLGIIKDALRQYTRMYSDIGAIVSNPEGYYNQFKTGYYECGCIERFLSPEIYIPVLERAKQKPGMVCIDAFTDMAFFKEILRKCGLRNQAGGEGSNNVII